MSAAAQELLWRLRGGELHEQGPGFGGRDPVEEPSASAVGDDSSLDDFLLGEAADRPPTVRGPARPSPGRFRAALRDRLPPALHGAVVDPALRGALALAAVALVAALGAFLFAWRGAPHPVAAAAPLLPQASGARPASDAVSLPAAGSVSTASGASAGSAVPATGGGGPAAGSPVPGAPLVVDVDGKVRRPGIVTVPAGSRVADAVDRAGGVLPGTDTSALSLARRLVDGEQILVTGRPGTAAASGPEAPAAAGSAPAATAPAGTGGDAGATSGSATPTTPLDLNTATVDQLDGLPGVGPVLAGRILEWRTQHGSFRSVDELRQVKGLGGKTGQELMALVRV